MCRRTFTFIFIVLTLMVRVAISTAAVPTSQPAEKWSLLPPAQWPQLVLTNEASYTGHTELHGASSFLIRMPDGEVLVGTAKHLTREAGGVTPPVPMAEFDPALTKWQVFPRTQSDKAIDAKGLAITINREISHDWLLLHLVDRDAKLPATPLAPRLRPVEIGETVYLIGVPYSDRKSAQNVYKGVVTARPSRNYFTYEFAPAVRINGFSGAPIVDKDGLLVGHGVSHSETLKQQDGLEIEFGGEDATLAVTLWEHRKDPPTTQPSLLVHVDLPDVWQSKQSHVRGVLIFAEHKKMQVAFLLVASPKSDYDDDVDLLVWAKRIKALTTKASRLTHLHETDLKENKIGGRKTIEYESSGETKSGTEIHYRYIMLEMNDCYCKVAGWTTAPNWDAAQPAFEEIITRMK